MGKHERKKKSTIDYKSLAAEAIVNLLIGIILFWTSYLSNHSIAYEKGESPS